MFVRVDSVTDDTIYRPSKPDTAVLCMPVSWKRLELLRELVPQAAIIAVLFETQPVRMPTYSGLQQ